MMHLIRHIPAWMLWHLPVLWARRCVQRMPPVPTPSQTTLQLLVDVSVIYQTDARTGIQRVVRALLLQLLHKPPTGFRVCPVFATRRQGYRYAAENFLDFPKQSWDSEAQPVQVQRGDLFLALDLAAHLLPRHQAQVLHWKRSGVQLHVLVYDLLPLLHPEWFTQSSTRNFERWIQWLAVYADNVICISQAVKTELRTWLSARFALPPGSLRMSTIVLGSDIDASAPSEGLPPNAENSLQYFRSIPTILMVGTLEPRKGYDQVIAAFELLWRNSCSAPLLIIVGRSGWKTDDLQQRLRNHNENGKGFFWLSNVSDEYLTQLYAACTGVLLASHAEGFGLPLVEGIRHGKPVLARDIPVFRELQTQGISYFQSNTAAGLAKDILSWMSMISESTTSPKNIHSTPALSTWQSTANQLIEALDLKNQIPID